MCLLRQVERRVGRRQILRLTTRQPEAGVKVCWWRAFLCNAPYVDVELFQIGVIYSQRYAIRTVARIWLYVPAVYCDGLGSASSEQEKAVIGPHKTCDRGVLS